MTALYSENDPYAAAWLRKLISEGFIAPGVVDERDMREIEAWELAPYTQVHFCAGIGIWSYALRSAGWSDERPIWTGSFPCQPFSVAGKRKGFKDERHLWPFAADLIRICKPSVFVGEQVARKDGFAWLDHVSTDLEDAGYAFGAADLCAAGVEGYHIRQRSYFVGLADSGVAGLERRIKRRDSADQCVIGANGMVGGMADRYGGDAGTERQQRSRQYGQQPQNSRALVGWADAGRSGGRSSPLHVRSDFADWIFCRDAKWRPVEPATFPLVDAYPGRMGRLRAYGNALDAETAITFCEAVAEIAGV